MADRVRVSRSDLIEALLDCTHQSCSASDGMLDSMCISAYADALRILALLGEVVIVAEHGRRVIAKLPEPPAMTAPCVSWLLTMDSSDHSCHLTKGHNGPHRCDCGTEWEDR